MTGIDPIKVTEYSIVLSAAGLPLTYFPILVVADDRGYMGDKTNGPAVVTSRVGTHYRLAVGRDLRRTSPCGCGAGGDEGRRLWTRCSSRW